MASDKNLINADFGKQFQIILDAEAMQFRKIPYAAFAVKLIYSHAVSEVYVVLLQCPVRRKPSKFNGTHISENMKIPFLESNANQRSGEDTSA